MAGRAFSPGSVTIAAGGSVTFVNDDDREHTATGDSFDTGVLNPGAQSRESFASAGTFTFLCQIHPEMRGTVNVRGGSGTASPNPAATPTPAPTPSPTPVPPIVPEPGSQTASIVDFAFEPGEIDVAVGTTVTWQNRGAAPHTVTADDGSFGSGLIAAGASYTQDIRVGRTLRVRVPVPSRDGRHRGRQLDQLRQRFGGLAVDAVIATDRTNDDARRTPGRWSSPGRASRRRSGLGFTTGDRSDR